MNQKEFQLIAGVLYGSMIQLSTSKQADQWRDLVFKMTDMLELSYPKTFDRNKFIQACGLGATKVSETSYKCYEEHTRGKYAGVTPPHWHE